MTDPLRPLLLRGAHVIDPAQGIDGIADVAIEADRIRSLENLPAHVETLDLHGHYLTPGWIDVHVHVYGTLGFADPDSIGVCQGVTSYVEAGGPGIGTLDEFVAMMEGRTRTSLYAGAYVRPLGILGLNFIEGDVRTLTNIPIADWLDFAAAHPGLLRYLKVGSFSGYGRGPVKLAKGLAEILGLPLYAHIGEHQQQPGSDSAYEIYRVAEAGDMVTHIYHGNECGILDGAGKVLPLVRAAQQRGVLFDVGFGGYNFSWGVAEKAYAQDFLPDLISSDLQQFNVAGPAYSLSNVMTCFLKLGMPLEAVIERVTAAPAKALSLSSVAGSLQPGMPADLTVFKLQRGEIILQDTDGRKRPFDTRIVPSFSFKAGQRVEADLERCQDEHNWLIEIAEDHIPQAAARLSSPQRAFLDALATRLGEIDWAIYTADKFDYPKSLVLQDAFHQLRVQRGLSMQAALKAVFDSFLDAPFTVQIGLFLLRLEREFALRRMREVAGAFRSAA